MPDLTHHPECWRDPEHHACAVREVERLHEAIQRVAERRRRPGEGHTGWYERLAEMFCRDTGHMAPGKSAPMEMHRDPEEDRRKWEEWTSEPYDALVAMVSGRDLNPGGE